MKEKKSFQTIDPRWENQIYGKQQQLNQYPFDFVVTFVHRYCDKSKPSSEISILEVGCGVGNNLWFAAREGFRVSGIDGSSTAIQYAQNRFLKDGLSGEFRVGDFSSLPYADESFDLVIDRGALTNCGNLVAGESISHVYRVLRRGGRFLFNPYSRKHTSYCSGEDGSDGLTINITGGVLKQYDRICFYDREAIERLLMPRWQILSMRHYELSELIEDVTDIHAEWRVVAEKPL